MSNEPRRDDQQNGRNGKWKYRKEQILMFTGILLIVYEAVLAGDRFHYEIILAGLALCGVSIAQWGDKK